MRYILLVWLTSVLLGLDVTGQTRKGIEQATRDYYSQWIGVKAPEFIEPLKDRIDNGSELRIQNFQGKRLLLFAFDAGDFADGPRDEKMLMQQLTALHKSKQLKGGDVAVIGFTYGPAFFMPDVDMPTAIKDKTDFPIVNNVKLAHTPLQEPYNLLQRWPSLLVIDKNGVFIGAYSPPLIENDILQAFLIDDWTGKVRLPPREEPPEILKKWSSRTFWTVFAYTKDFGLGSTFQKGCGRIHRIYLEADVPADRVLGLKMLEGVALKKNVKAGDTIRRSDFENKD